MDADFLHAKDIARVLGISTKRVYDLVKMGEIPHAFIGRRIVIPTRSWETFLADKHAEAMASLGVKKQ
jgi:excisionase family DNA binding protein